MVTSIKVVDRSSATPLKPTFIDAARVRGTSPHQFFVNVTSYVHLT
jgi:hypothetical protein